jgi:hypothetical protein
LERRSDNKIFGRCSLPKSIQFAEQHAIESLSSRWRRLNNGLPQGSVLAPILFILTFICRICYADDIAVTYQAKSFDECENDLEADIEVLNQFFHRWYLQPNPGTTEMCVFHLNTHAANK